MLCSEDYSSRGFRVVSKGLALHFCSWLQQSPVLSEKEVVCLQQLSHLTALEGSLAHGSAGCLLDPVKILLLFLQPVPVSLEALLWLLTELRLLDLKRELDRDLRSIEVPNKLPATICGHIPVAL